MKRVCILIMVVLFAVASTASSQETEVPTIAASGGRPIEIDPDVLEQAEQAISLGLNWLAQLQRDNGSWSTEKFPALTAMSLWAFTRGEHPEKKEIIRKAVSFLVKQVQDDGGLYRKARILKKWEMTTQNTAMCMIALNAAKDYTIVPKKIILDAREFIADSQSLGDDAFRGGFGYGRPKKGKDIETDLSNTARALEAMRLTEDIEKERPAGQEKADIDWEAARSFLDRLQVPAGGDDANAGGFTYRPEDKVDRNQAGTLRTYGTLTYNGLLSLVHAQVDRDDPRVRSAFDWAVKNWSLDENPGMGPDGLFFFYNVMAKALEAFGADTVPAKKPVKWREEIVKKIVSHQKEDKDAKTGYWVNDESNRFWESNPVLVTAYSLLALESAIGR